MGNKSIKLTTLSINATEEITKSNLCRFILSNSDHNMEDNIYFYATYIKQKKIYEILLFDLDKNNLPIPFIFQHYYKADVNSTDLFIQENYFVVYQNGKLLLYKEVTKSDQDDILLYLNQKYDLTIDNIYKINIDEILKLKKQLLYFHIKNQVLPLQTKSKTKFIVYSILILIVIFLLNSEKIINKTNTNIKNSTDLVLKVKELKYLKLQTIYNSKQMPISFMEEFFKYLKLNKINIKNISYSSRSLSTILSHNQKEQLLNLATLMNDNITLNFIKKQNDTYMMGVTILIKSKKVKKEFDELQRDIVKKDSFFIVNMIEEKSKEFNIELDNIDLNSNIITIKFNTFYNEMINFGRFIELHFDIEKLEILQNNNTFDISIQINPKYIFNIDHTLLKERDILNPYVKYRRNKTIVVNKMKKNQSCNLSIKAIIQDEVLIDNIWYKVSSTINKCKIIKITNDHIIVQDKKNNRYTIVL